MNDKTSVDRAPVDRVVHTPGPWKAELADMHAVDDEDRDTTRWSVLTDYQTGGDYFIATIENGAPGDIMRTEEANAKAIAAVPLMIEVLEEVALPPWSDSDLAGLLNTLRVRAQSVLDKIKVV